MGRAGLSLLVGVVSLLAIGVEAAEWKTHKYPADSFQVEFSGSVSVTDEMLSEPEYRKKLVRSTMYRQTGADHGYVVTATLHVGIVGDFEHSARTGFALLKCTATKYRAIKMPGVQSFALSGTNCINGAWHAEVRYFIRDRWTYQVMTRFKKDGGDVDAANRFLDSFQLTGE
jgi:hypothetical protein